MKVKSKYLALFGSFCKLFPGIYYSDVGDFRVKDTFFSRSGLYFLCPSLRLCVSARDIFYRFNNPIQIQIAHGRPRRQTKPPVKKVFGHLSPHNPGGVILNVFLRRCLPRETDLAFV